MGVNGKTGAEFREEGFYEAVHPLLVSVHVIKSFTSVHYITQPTVKV